MSGLLQDLPINPIDLIVLVVLAISGLLGLFRGFVHEVLGIFAWIGAGLATLYGFVPLQPYAHRYISIPLLADVATGVGIFLVVLIVLSLAVRLLAIKVKESALGVLDRSLGLAFGLLRGVALVCLAWIAFAAWIPQTSWPDWVEEAKSPPLLDEGGRVMIALVPEDLLQDGTDALKDMIRDDKGFEGLQSPVTKGDASQSEPVYNAEDRDALQQKIEENSQ